MDIAFDVEPVLCRVRKKYSPVDLKQPVLDAQSDACHKQVRRAESAGSA